MLRTLWLFYCENRKPVASISKWSVKPWVRSTGRPHPVIITIRRVIEEGRWVKILVASAQERERERKCQLRTVRLAWHNLLQAYTYWMHWMTVLFAPNKGGNCSFNYIGRIMAMCNKSISLANRWNAYGATNRTSWHMTSRTSHSDSIGVAAARRHTAVWNTMKLDIECVD